MYFKYFLCPINALCDLVSKIAVLQQSIKPLSGVSFSDTDCSLDLLYNQCGRSSFDFKDVQEPLACN